jgi:hypothetical protein
MILGLLDPDPDPLVRVRDPDPAPGSSMIKHKYANIYEKLCN